MSIANLVYNNAQTENKQYGIDSCRGVFPRAYDISQRHNDKISKQIHYIQCNSMDDDNQNQLNE